MCHILIGLFTLYFAQNCILLGAQSITSGGSLILNQAFPRSLLPLSSAISAAKQFLPTIPIYILIVLGGKIFLNDDSLPGLSLNYLLLPILFLLLVITSFGLSLLFAALNVYFRDTTKLLSYIMRIWLYASPILWQPEMLNVSYRVILYLNPLGPILSVNSRIWIDEQPPTSGQITVNGRISTLLGLGVGFNKALSGRDNIILGGLAVGMSKAKIQSQTDSIAEFADLPEGFIDIPVRTYSNGMYSRVAFAVAVNMTPDILLLDEALSAGDVAFKEKSFNRMRELCAEARTILIVSHALSSLNELCDRAIWLHKGKMLASEKPEDITEQYLKFLNVGELPSSYEDL